MIKRFMQSAILAMTGMLLFCGVASATWQFIFPIKVADTSGITRAYYPVLLGFGGQSLVDSAKISASGNNTNMQIGSANISYMMSTTNITAVIPILPAGGVVNTSFYTGYSPEQSGFPIIVGDSGNVTVSDNASLELGDNFTYQTTGWINTDAGVDKNLILKPEAFRTFVSNTVAENITAAISSVGNQTEIRRPDGNSICVLPNEVGVACPNHWQNVDEAVPNDADSVGILAAADNKTDVYTLANTAIPGTATIISVTATIRGEDNGTNAEFRVGLRIGADTTWGTYWSDAAWTTHTETLARPGGGDWEVADLDGLLYCVNGHTFGGGDSVFISWCYITVRYVDWDIAVTATGVSSGEHDVEVKGDVNSDTWATGDVLHFNGTISANVTAGDIYNGGTSEWWSFWFKLDTATGPAGDWNQMFVKRADALNLVRFGIRGDTGEFQIYHVSGGAVAMSMLSTQTAWNADQWYHVTLTIFATGVGFDILYRMAIDDGVIEESTNVGGHALPLSGNFTMGNWANAGIGGMKGEFSNWIMGTDNLTLAEIANLNLGIAPGDETDYWYMDEGTGVAIPSYGSAANPGTAGANCTWEVSTYTTGQTGRLTDYAIDIDSGTYRGGINAIGKGVSVSDNSENWTLMAGNSMSYADNITLSVNGTQHLYFAPIAMLVGATIPDRGAGVDNPGTINWGSNTNVNISYGALESYESYIASIAMLGGFDMPAATLPSTWFASGENLANLPFYDAFSKVAAETGRPVQMIYATGIIGLAFGAFLMVVMFTRSALMAWAAMVMVLIIGSSQTIIPWWIPFTVIISGLSIMYLYRQVA